MSWGLLMPRASPWGRIERYPTSRAERQEEKRLQVGKGRSQGSVRPLQETASSPKLRQLPPPPPPPGRPPGSAQRPALRRRRVRPAGRGRCAGRGQPRRREAAAAAAAGGGGRRAEEEAGAERGGRRRGPSPRRWRCGRRTAAPT